MRNIRFARAIGMLGILLASERAYAQNDSAATAVPLMVGQPPHATTVDGSNTERWYAYPVAGGRSYCVEVVMRRDTDTFIMGGDPRVFVYQTDGITLITSNDDSGSLPEPGGFSLSRACYMFLNTQLNYLKIQAHTVGTVSSFEFRVVETTLYSNWFFVGCCGYGAFTLIKNTTTSPISFSLSYVRGAGPLAGGVLASYLDTLPPNGLKYIDAASFPANVLAGSGSIEIMHSGPPDAIMATTTTLSGSTGLSFDTLFVRRQPW